MPSRPDSRQHDFARRAVSVYLKLALLYGLYALQALFHGFRSSVSVPDRLVMTAGSASIVLSLLVPPAVFAAALSAFDPIDETAPGNRKRDWYRLVAMALGAWLLSGLGPVAADVGLYKMRDAAGLPGRPATFTEVMVLVPVAIGLFVVLSGVAGALVGQRTRGLSRWRCHLVRWVACLALVAAFWFPVMGAGALVDRHGVSVAWLLVLLPLTAPFLATWLLMRMQGYELRDILPAPTRATRYRPLDPACIDQLTTIVVEGPSDADPATAGELAFKNEAEAEMFRFVAGLRRAVAPGAPISERKVQEIVRAVVEVPVPPEPARKQVRLTVPAWWPKIDIASMGEFGVSWACLTVGLLFLGLVGGTAPNLLAAAVLALLGTAVTMLLAEHRPIPIPATAAA